MACEWQEVRLGDVVDLLTGFPFKSEQYTDDSSDPRLIRGDNVVQGSFRWDGVKRWPPHLADGLDSYWLQEDDVILAMDRPWIDAGLKYAAIQKSDLPALLVQRVARLRGTKDLDTGFLRYVVGSRSFTDYILGVQTGTAVPHISGQQIRAFAFRLPPISEQKAIAEILGSLDDKIELNRRTNETLEAIARALFKSWFVDFDPVHAKSKGRQPDGMDAETAKLFPSSFVDSEIGRVPKGWKVGTVGDVSDINAWTLGKNDDLDPIEYVEISEVNRGDIGNIQVFKRGQEPSRARRRLRHGDSVLSTVRPDRRSYFLCLDPSQNLIASTGFAVLSPTKVPWSFLHAGLIQPDVFVWLGQHADGGAYPAVRPELIGQWWVPLPDNPAVLDAFHCVCSGLFEKAEGNRRQTIVLSQLRDSLLPRLLSGEITVPVPKVA